MVDLNLSAASIRMIAQKARALSTSIPDTYEDGHEGDMNFNPVSLKLNRSAEGLAEEENDDLLDDELRELIADLNVDEAAELVAITWIGRGDFDPADFDQAVIEAKERATNSTATYLLGLPHLPDHLENGLNELQL